MLCAAHGAVCSIEFAVSSVQYAECAECAECAEFAVCSVFTSAATGTHCLLSGEGQPVKSCVLVLQMHFDLGQCVISSQCSSDKFISMKISWQVERNATATDTHCLLSGEGQAVKCNPVQCVSANSCKQCTVSIAILILGSVSAHRNAVPTN